MWKNFHGIYLKIKAFDSQEDTSQIDEEVIGLKQDLKER